MKSTSPEITLAVKSAGVAKSKRRQSTFSKEWLMTMLWRFIIVAVILVIWESAVRLEMVNGFLMGSPSAILDAAITMAKLQGNCLQTRLQR